MIQPLHALTYMTFMLIASKILTVAPILSVVFMNFLGKADKIVRSVFRLNNGIITSGMKEAGNSMKEGMNKLK